MIAEVKYSSYRVDDDGSKVWTSHTIRVNNTRELRELKQIIENDSRAELDSVDIKGDNSNVQYR